MYAQVYPFCETMLAVADTISFANWLEGEMRKAELSQAELARAAGVTRSAINGILTGRRGPGSDLCRAIARALGIPEEAVFRVAGILQSKADLDEDTEELLYLYDRLPVEAKNQVVDFTRFLVERKDSDTNGQAKK